MLADYASANLICVKPGKTYRMKFTVNNIATGDVLPLSTSEFEFSVAAPADTSVVK
jgi:hypothetical protein